MNVIVQMHVSQMIIKNKIAKYPKKTFFVSLAYMHAIGKQRTTKTI